MSTTIEWVDQRRSTFAFEKVKEITGKPWKKDFKVFVKDSPMLLLCNSVPYTMAFTFYKSRGTKPSLAHFAVWNLCIEWLKSKPLFSELIKGNTDTEILNKIAALDILQSSLLGIELDALFIWLKWFADGLIVK